LESVLHENFPDVIVAPFLLTAGTDARRFSDIADAILRFAPIDLNKQQFASIHSKNEHISIENIGQCVQFYKKLIHRIAD
jgi:carboxypeptidase PM20D1